eukprot:353367-Chlamydomonas_euryale.AAC.3
MQQLTHMPWPWQSQHVLTAIDCPVVSRDRQKVMWSRNHGACQTNALREVAQPGCWFAQQSTRHVSYMSAQIRHPTQHTAEKPLHVVWEQKANQSDVDQHAGQSASSAAMGLLCAQVGFDSGAELPPLPSWNGDADVPNTRSWLDSVEWLTGDPSPGSALAEALTASVAFRSSASRDGASRQGSADNCHGMCCGCARAS